MKKIGVVFGGKSCEHDISIITGVLTLNSVNADSFTAIPIYVSSSGVWYTGNELFDISFYKTKNLKKLKRVTLLNGDTGLYEIRKNKLKLICNLDCLINCTHGVNGEDGTITGVANSSNIALVGADFFGASLSMDKDFTKIALNGLNVNCLPHLVLVKGRFYANRNSVLSSVLDSFSLPVIIKPARLGSSVGISVATDKKTLTEGLINAFNYDEKVIIEPYKTGIVEINCAVYQAGGKIIASECEEPLKSSEILSFKDKYETDSYERLVCKKFPADIPVEISNKIKQISKNIYEKCGFSGVIRIDFMLVDNEILVNEINSVPGSMAYYLFSDTLKGFSDILTDLISCAIIKKRLENGRDYTYFSKVLNIGGIKGGKTGKRK